ncbi:MAG TPA: hypothetical protein VFY34_10525 [Pyrinomonadaceae bacterium]|nr:hypothetical protein [Pyrinomonadaceae bacterium]
MNKLKVLTMAVSVGLLLTLVSSVRADSVNSAKGPQNLNFGVLHTLDLPNMTRAEFRDFLAEQLDASEFGGILVERFEGNNGLHLGWFKQKLQLGLNSHNEQHLASAGSNNGKHVGFSVAAFNPGMRFGLVNPRRSSPTVTENPEPTGMILLGTGLAAAAGFARRKMRRRRHPKDA